MTKYYSDDHLISFYIDLTRDDSDDDADDADDDDDDDSGDDDITISNAFNLIVPFAATLWGLFAESICYCHAAPTIIWLPQEPPKQNEMIIKMNSTSLCHVTFQETWSISYELYHLYHQIKDAQQLLQTFGEIWPPWVPVNVWKWSILARRLGVRDGAGWVKVLDLPTDSWYFKT